ncbi:hypothetical protein TTHERM_00384760 (macronuclear) [Tetrahymena thermophila SB210]|uniref:Kinase domain protein n=1 Tax=Tetrahymena thermophila (strain SB210) TaxID=312017 RepID=Q23RL6_TETTS|nr:hypothetical protein TTHERM_00384760 [Tetrahymena thermophila SB210]EAR99032.1 hypothetical protein TTHERM_00384760 [Tetrahymena thermophila SB210]|eukprot:XP_001019277.1 hypothetical protein TTHERM_00384760 [Tetrahymena thermophila SB210]
MINVFQAKVPARFIRYDNLSSYKLEQNQLQSLNKLIIVLSDGDVLDFDKFKQTIDALDDISELQMKINISDSDEVHEVFQYLLNTAFPKFKNTVQQIAFEMFQIKTKSANLTQNQELQTLYDFLSIIDKKNGSNVCFKQLDIKIELDKNNQKLVEELLKLPNQLGVLTNLEGISIDFNNLGLDQQYFQALFKAIQKMSKLKKLCMNISKNRLTVNNTLSFIQQIAKISCNIQSLAYIDSQMINAQCMDKFVQGMKRFKNLKELYLQGISFSQHTGGKFFSIFSCLPQLEKLNLDLFDCKINQEDMGFLVKNIQTLTNLDSLYLVFPTQKQYSEKKSICQAIVQIFQRFENQLKSLQLEVNERFYSEESNLIAEAICQLRKLKFLQIIYGGNYIQVTDNNQDSIWDQMQPQISYTSRENIFLCILYNKIMLNQNSEMSSLSIEYTDNYQFKQEDYQKFTKMKSLTFNLVGYQINHILIMKIIQAYPQNLKQWSSRKSQKFLNVVKNFIFQVLKYISYNQNYQNNCSKNNHIFNSQQYMKIQIYLCLWKKIKKKTHMFFWKQII